MNVEEACSRRAFASLRLVFRPNRTIVPLK